MRDEALSLGREAGDAWAVSFGLFLQGLAAVESATSTAAARAKRRESRRCRGRSREHIGPLIILANIAVSNGDNDRAQELYDESIEVVGAPVTCESGNIQLSCRGRLRIVREDFEDGASSSVRAMALCQRTRGPARNRLQSRSVRRGCWPPADSPTERLDGASLERTAGKRCGGTLFAAWSFGIALESVRRRWAEHSDSRAEGRAMPPWWRSLSRVSRRFVVRSNCSGAAWQRFGARCAVRLRRRAAFASSVDLLRWPLVQVRNVSSLKRPGRSDLQPLQNDDGMIRKRLTRFSDTLARGQAFCWKTAQRRHARRSSAIASSEDLPPRYATSLPSVNSSVAEIDGGTKRNDEVSERSDPCVRPGAHR